MSLRYLVVKAITDRGCGTMVHIEQPLIEMGYTPKQIKGALHNARNKGLLWCEETGRGRPVVYWPGKRPISSMWDGLGDLARKRDQKPQPMLIASVWYLGNPKPETAWPKGQGTVHRPLGPWHSV